MLAYTVAQQRQEIAVRLALGAEPGRIAAASCGMDSRSSLAGVIPGVGVAFAAGRSMSALLFGVQPDDPATLLVTVGLCLCMAVTGALLPALRAVRTSPMSVMRSE